MSPADHSRDAEVERRVAERTRVLAAQNDALRLELNAILDSIPAGAAWISATGESEYANKYLRDYFGKTMDELRDWVSANVVHPDELASSIQSTVDSLRTGVPYFHEQRQRRFDGVYRWFQVRALPVRDEAGGILRWCVLHTDIDERKRAEEALRESEENLKLIVDTIPALAWTARPDGSSDFINKHYADYVGIAADELAEWGWPRAVHPDDFPELAAIWSKALESGEPAEAEARLQRADGEYRWFLFRTSPLRDERGAIVKWYGVNTDIHDRKQTEEELRRSEAFLNQAQRLTLTGSLWLNARTQEVSWSEESYRLLDVPRTVKPTVDLIISRCHPEDLPRWQEQAERVFGEGANMDLEHRVIMPNGAIKHVHVVLQRTGAPDGAEFVGAVTDITERRRVERALKEASNHLNEGQRLSQSGSFTADLRNDVHTWSDEFCRICELAPGTAMTLEKIRALVHPDDVALFARALDVAQTGGDPIFSFRIVTQSGAVKQMQGSAHHLEGHLLVGAIQDVTERRRNEDALDRARTDLAHASRALSLSALTASIAHEINQPLSGVLMNANTCLRMLQRTNLAEAEEAARLTIRDGKRASEVIARLRTLFSKKDFAPAPLDLNAAAREVLTLSRRELEQRRVVVETVFAKDLPKVLGDRVQLQQVILNLVLNASDAMKEIGGGRRLIVIETRRHEADAARISVRDNGIGIAPDSLTQVFDPFYTTKAEGMGIGLSVSRSIIERHQGQIWASANEDVGATFSFTIPCAHQRINDGCEAP